MNVQGRAPYDPELLQEYIMNERGLIWSGSENDHEEQKWYYGQFDQVRRIYVHIYVFDACI